MHVRTPPFFSKLWNSLKVVAIIYLMADQRRKRLLTITEFYLWAWTAGALSAALTIVAMFWLFPFSVMLLAPLYVWNFFVVFHHIYGENPGGAK